MPSSVTSRSSFTPHAHAHRRNVGAGLLQAAQRRPPSLMHRTVPHILSSKYEPPARLPRSKIPRTKTAQWLFCHPFRLPPPFALLLAAHAALSPARCRRPNSHPTPPTHTHTSTHAIPLLRPAPPQTPRSAHRHFLLLHLLGAALRSPHFSPACGSSSICCACSQRGTGRTHPAAQPSPRTTLQRCEPRTPRDRPAANSP